METNDVGRTSPSRSSDGPTWLTTEVVDYPYLSYTPGGPRHPWGEGGPKEVGGRDGKTGVPDTQDGLLPVCKDDNDGPSPPNWGTIRVRPID